MSRVFEEFNPMGKCPLCRTNKNEKTVLISMAGTQRGHICQAEQFHLDCLLDNLVYYPEKGVVAAVLREKENKEETNV